MLQGKLTISRPRGDGCDYITIEVIDELSYTEFVEVRVKYADFTEALTGLSHTPCEFELRADNVGKKRETKQERVFVPYKCDDVAACINPLNVDC